MSNRLYFHQRMPTDDGTDSGGVTVSKREKLPVDDFSITEYRLGQISLWFLDDDHFTADQRQEAFDAYLSARPQDYT